MKKRIVCMAALAALFCLPAAANTLQDKPKPANYQVIKDKDKMNKINNDSKAKVNNAMPAIEAKNREAQKKHQQEQQQKQQSQQKKSK